MLASKITKFHRQVESGLYLFGALNFHNNNSKPNWLGAILAKLFQRSCGSADTSWRFVSVYLAGGFGFLRTEVILGKEWWPFGNVLVLLSQRVVLVYCV